MTLTRAKLVHQIAKEQGRSKAEVDRVAKRMLELLALSLAKGERVELRDFGVFHVVERPAHEGADPRTGERVERPRVRFVSFRTGKALSEALNAPQRPDIEDE